MPQFHAVMQRRRPRVPIRQQRPLPLKLRLAAQEVVEGDFDLLTIEIAGKVEQVHLQQRLDAALARPR